jgi:Fe-S cluster biosynthesis and repair protein YggX
VIGEKFLEINKKHTRGMETLYIKDALQKGMEMFSEQKNMWSTWIDKQITLAEAQKKLEALELHKKETIEINKEIELRSGLMLKSHGHEYLRLWLFYNLLTQYITHGIKSVMRQRELNFRVAKAFNHNQ